MSDATSTSGRETKSTASLISEAMAHISGLVRKEIDLTRAELNENLKKAAAAVGAIVGAVVLILTALNVLSAALVAGLTKWLEIDAGWSALIVGGVFLIVAFIMLKSGTNALKATSLAPTRSAKSVQRDAHAIKESFNGQH